MKVSIIKSPKIVWKVFLNVILLFPIVGENVISTAGSDVMSRLLSVVSCAAIFLFLLIKRKIQMNQFLLTMLLLIVLHSAVTFLFLGSNTVITVANNMVTPYGLIAYFALFIYMESFWGNRQMLIIVFKSLSIIMTITVVMNFLFDADLHYANNIEALTEALITGYTNSRLWLFGHRNMIGIHHIMWITFTCIQFYLEKRNYVKVFIFQITFTLLVGIISWNSTMLLVTGIIMCLAMFRNNLLSKLSVLHYTAIYAFLEIGIVFFRIQNVFSYLIVNILHRNLSFTGRTSIWDYYIRQFLSSSVLHKLFGNFGVTDLTVNSHNMFLGILAFTGISGGILYLYLIYIAVRKLYQERRTDSARLISIMIFGFLMNSLTMEFYLQPLVAIYIGYKIKEINHLVQVK